MADVLGTGVNVTLPFAQDFAEAHTDGRVWIAATGSCCVTFTVHGMGPSAECWTTRAGLEALRDALNAALVHTDA